MILTYMVIGEVNCMQAMPALLFSTKNYEVASDCACISSFCVYTKSWAGPGNEATTV